jgi:hypothetical protein
VSSTPATLTIDQIIAAALRGEIDEDAAARVFELGREATIAVLLAVVQGKAKAAGPHTPSGSVPVYQKAAASTRRKKPGAKVGHEGSRRQTPPPTQTVDHAPLSVCPDCGDPVQPAKRTRVRIIQDITPQTKVETTEHRLPRSWCGTCKKEVEPKVPDAFPGATLGNRLVVFTAWLHYMLGITMGHIGEILGGHLNTTISAGGLTSAWFRTAAVLEAWYEQIAEQARQSAVLHADETGWRVNGVTHWLWCFCNPDSCYYLIDPGRGRDVAQRFFKEEFQGTLVCDFLAVYDELDVADFQRCLAHLLREICDVDDRVQSEGWLAFSKPCKRLIGDGLRLRALPDFTKEKYESRITRLNQRLVELAGAEYSDPDATRLAKRLFKHQDSILTFLDTPGVDPTNNRAERMIRPAVIARKNIQGNRSEQGAATQAVLMSVFRTLKLRGHDPLPTLEHALRAYNATGTLPPLPARGAASG